MFARLGHLINRRRWASLAVVVLLTVLCGAWGAGVFTAFKQDDFSVPGAESTRVAQPLDADEKLLQTLREGRRCLQLKTTVELR